VLHVNKFKKVVRKLMLMWV